MLQELICQRKCGRLGMVFSAEAPACMEILESIYFHTIKNMTCPGRGHMQGNSRDLGLKSEPALSHQRHHKWKKF